ncbi:unnamed protein product [Acanthoscelides obtectus]|uniref:Uncharacterized protein n=1 Tax=Acanthoscelides obtectus TaxID=200917 RepID=A0A9P0JSI2_ACAOB|nr:unnamed protein product [Acanthoscelides obtectus]CAK1621856.1 hypothetical protein AOBTE_LOCUS1174 [Acanthoscelides obtectus]
MIMMVGNRKGSTTSRIRSVELRIDLSSGFSMKHDRLGLR